MTEGTITSLINLGAAGAVIIVVVYFLRFIAKRDNDWQSFFERLMKQQDGPMVELTQAIRQLLSEFQKHDTWEHTKLDEMGKVISSRSARKKDQEE